MLSGINHGANLGEDVTYSGTIAAAMEGAVLGMPAVAFSQVRPVDKPAHWAPAQRFVPEILRAVTSIPWPREVLYNVNFPALPPDRIRGVVVCRQGRRDQGTEIVEGVDPGGRPYVWIGAFRSDETSQANSDLAAIASGAVSLTPLHLDLTHGATLKKLSEMFS